MNTKLGVLSIRLFSNQRMAEDVHPCRTSHTLIWFTGSSPYPVDEVQGSGIIAFDLLAPGESEQLLC